MNNNLSLVGKQPYSKLAVDKIAAELKDFKGDRYGMAVKNHVAATLTHFCEQDERFAEVVYKTKRTLSDCCAEIMKGCGQSISDIDVYRGAVRHYFPNADIDFHMTITFTGEAPTAEEMDRPAAQKPEGKPEKKTKGNVPAKKEKPAQAHSKAPKTGTKTPKAPPMPPVKPVEQPKKPTKKQSKFEDPNVIQLTLF